MMHILPVTLVCVSPTYVAVSNRRDSLMETSVAASETTIGDLSIGSEVTFDMSYRTDFDDLSMTEQEKVDRSFRALLPSESHRRRHRSASCK